MKYTKEDIVRIVNEEDIEFIRLQFTDIFGQLKNVAAGTGRMDYSAILAFLKARKPYVQATLENTDDTNAVWAREHMESLYQQVN